MEEEKEKKRKRKLTLQPLPHSCYHTSCVATLDNDNQRLFSLKNIRRKKHTAKV